jgi:transcriptional regulator with XRE-family HTH domain
VTPKSRSQQKSDLSITRTEAVAIGARVRQLRGSEKAGEFARRIGIAREHLSRIESGAQVPGTETLRRLAQVSGASLDFVVLGSDRIVRMDAAAGDGGWEAALGPLLAGTSLRLRGASAAARRRADRAWAELSEGRRDDVRTLVRQVALLAVAIETLLPAKTGNAVIDELGDALTGLVVDRIAAARPVS